MKFYYTTLGQLDKGFSGQLFAFNFNNVFIFLIYFPVNLRTIV